MSTYKFIDEQERLTKKWFVSYAEAQAFARNNNLQCLTMEYKEFLASFEMKVERFKDHPDYSMLVKKSIEAIAVNQGFGHAAIAANDFMQRVVELPTAYIADWLDGKNELKWLPEYLSEAECENVVTYSTEENKALNMVSVDARKLYEVFKKEYINNGYSYSGMIPMSARLIKGFPAVTIEELIDAGILRRRNCSASAYELTPVERKKLIDHYNLSAVWECTLAGRAYSPNGERGEISNVLRAVANESKMAQRSSLAAQIQSASSRVVEPNTPTGSKANAHDTER